MNELVSSNPSPTVHSRCGCLCAARKCLVALIAVVVLIAYAWGCGAFWWSRLGPDWMRGTVTALFLLAGFVAVLRLRGVVRGLALVAIWLLPFAWFWLARPTNVANWEPPCSRAATIEVNGDQLTVRNVRNFHWRSDEDFDERWDDRTYDLSKLRTLDIFMSYWGPTLICHTFVSFGFEDGQQLAISVEVRKKIGEAYATVPSIFRMFELIYVFADERDIVYVRSNVRKEEVHLFRVKASPAGIRGLLVEYVNRANRLAAHPEWYNAVTNSCGVNVVQNAWAEGSRRPVSWRLLFNGQWARYAYDAGALDQSKPFDVLFADSIVDAAAQEVGYSPEFSAAIRAADHVTYTVPKAIAPTTPPQDPTPHP